MSGSGSPEIIVMLGIGADVRVPPERDPRSGRVREEWLVREIDPASAAALDLALRLKASRPGIRVTALHVGRAGTESWLRQAIARGCDRAVRVWDEDAADVRAAGKAVILAAAVRALTCDLALLGSSGVIDSGGQLGVRLAARLSMPCVTQAASIAFDERAGIAQIRRALDRGYQERVEAPLPLVVTVSPSSAAVGDAAGAPPTLSSAALLAAQAAGIDVWDLARLGVPLAEVRRAESALNQSSPRAPRPRLRPVAAPDPSLPAFDRILKLIEGSVQQREGRVVRRPPEEVVDDIFRTLRDEGWLDHLKAITGKQGATPDEPR